MKHHKHIKTLLSLSLIFFSAATQVLAQTEKTISDVEGNVYKTVTIGTQTWMAENLKVTKYNDGTPLQVVTDFNAWRDSYLKPAYCWYKNDKLTYGNIYGGLYNWYVVHSELDKNICPVNWHVPTKDEWATLSTHLTDTLAGGKLKEVGTKHWTAPNVGATNEVGFSALPAGYCSEMGLFKEIGTTTRWWTATEYDDTIIAWYMILHNNHKSMLSRNNDQTTSGYSIRCIKD